MADRNKAVIVGTIVPNENINLENWMADIKERYEAPDQFGKRKSVEFDVQDNFVDFWVS